MVINQVPVHRLSLDKAEDTTPVARDAHAPLLPAPVVLQRMQPVAGQFHVVGRLRCRRFRQDATDTAGQVLWHQSGIVPVRLVVTVLVCAHRMQHYVAEARCVASLAASSRLPDGALRSSGRFVAFTLKSLS